MPTARDEIREMDADVKKRKHRNPPRRPTYEDLAHARSYDRSKHVGHVLVRPESGVFEASNERRLVKIVIDEVFHPMPLPEGRTGILFQKAIDRDREATPRP